MKKVMRKITWVIFIVSFGAFPLTAVAQRAFELTPRISISEVYDDNIYLDHTNEKSDYITTVSPGISLSMSSGKNFLNLDYSPTWVWYDDYDENDTVRHAGTLGLKQNVAEHVWLTLNDTYVKSEDPLETDQDVESVRNTRNTYQRNRGDASLLYQFGQENVLTLGYKNNYLKNEDPTIDDGTIQNPYGNVTYWFNLKNGVEFIYIYTEAIFWRDEGSATQSDYNGNGAGLRYLYRFSPQTRSSIGYHFTNRNFERLIEDYNIHEGTLGFEHSFSPQLSLGLYAGAWTKNNERSANDTGYSYDASLVKRFERGSFSIGGKGGWDESYLVAESKGFIQYWSAYSRLEYRFIESLSGYAGGFVRGERDQDKRDSLTWRGNGGLRLAFLRWMSLSLDYTYAERNDEVYTEEYTDNRVMLILSAQKPFKW